jgi:hypothetical protein
MMSKLVPQSAHTASYAASMPQVGQRALHQRGKGWGVPVLVIGSLFRVGVLGCLAFDDLAPCDVAGGVTV